LTINLGRLDFLNISQFNFLERQTKFIEPKSFHIFWSFMKHWVMNFWSWNIVITKIVHLLKWLHTFCKLLVQWENKMHLSVRGRSKNLSALGTSYLPLNYMPWRNESEVSDLWMEMESGSRKFTHIKLDLGSCTEGSPDSSVCTYPPPKTLLHMKKFLISTSRCNIERPISLYNSTKSDSRQYYVQYSIFRVQPHLFCQLDCFWL